VHTVSTEGASGQARGDVEDRIVQLLGSRLRVSPEVLQASDSTTSLLGQGVGLDSIEALVLAVAIEEEFEIQVDDDDLTAALFETIGSVAAYVRRQAPAASG
jgi:acyl carrier protein